MAVVSLWSYWIVYCQPLDMYDIATATSTTTSTSMMTKTTTTSSASLAKTAKEPLSSKIGETQGEKSAEIANQETAEPSTVTQEDEGITDDEIGIDEDPEQEDEESESGDDDNESGTASDEEEEIDDGSNGEIEGQADDDRSPKVDGHQRVEIINSNIIPADERFKNHKYMFVHIGKAGGTTLRNNIRTLCTRKDVEQNILLQRRAKKPNKPKVGVVPCKRRLQKQADPSKYNPTTEMILSNDRVVGYLHMDFLTYWWNANDDGEAIDIRQRKPTIQDYISGIIASGAKDSKNITVFQDPPMYAEKDDGMTKSTAFLVPLRDPIDRLVSAFNYHHPENSERNIECDNIQIKKFTNWVSKSFYCQCFDTVNDLVNVFMEDGVSSKYIEKFKKPTEKVSCLEIAERVLMGKSLYKPYPEDENENQKVPGLKDYQQFDLELILKQKGTYTIGHITNNYGFYYRRTFLKYPDKDIVTIRTDHMWEDLQNLEYKLGGTALVKGEATGHASVTHGSSTYVTSEKITDPKGLQTICCVISSEAKIYVELLERAINLSDEQKKESITAFQKRCNLDLCSI